MAGAADAAAEVTQEPPQKQARSERSANGARTDRFLRASGRRFCGLGCRDHRGPDRPFHFMQLADTQLGMENNFTGQPGWDLELQLMRTAAAEVNRLRPAFAIVCGDLINEWPAEENGRLGADATARRQQIIDFKEAFSAIDEDIPLICLCGNHDIGDRPNSATIRSYRENFGDDYFSFWCNGVKCLVVNSQLWKDDSDAKELRDEMDRWLEAELEADSTLVPPPRILVFSHVPPFVFKPDEENEYFNLDCAFRRELMSRLARKGAVAWFCGHFHRNAGGIFRDAEDRELEVIVTAAVGTQIIDCPGGNPLGKSGIGGHLIGEEHSGLRLVKVYADRIEHAWKTFAELKAMPATEAAAC